MIQGHGRMTAHTAVKGIQAICPYRRLEGPLNVYLESAQSLLTEEKFLFLMSVLCTLAVPKDASEVPSRPVHAVRLGTVA
jgi:hypothetical protein